MGLLAQQTASQCQFQQRHAFRDRTACDSEEIPAVRPGEAAVPFAMLAKLERGEVKLVDQKPVSAWERFRRCANRVSVVDSLLINA